MTDDLPPDTEEALRFLEWLRPGGPWLLSAKRPDGPFETRSFAEAAAAREWIHARNGRSNLYVMINPAREGLNKKATKEDVSELAFLAVDLDVKQGSLEDGLERIELALVDFDPAPSGVIFSGGGYWAFWRLREPVHLGGGLAQIAAAEAYNRGLEVALGGDHCHNVDRVCRLPGTINIPDKAKRDRGRTSSVASIVDLTDAVHGLEDFTPAADAPPSRSSGSGAPTRVHISEDLPRLKSLDELPEAVTQRTRMLIVHGDDPDDPTRYGSKSEVMWAVTCELVRAGCDDHTIAAVLLDPDFGVSDHPLRQKGPVKYVERQIARARQDNDTGGRRLMDADAPFSTALRLREELLPTVLHTNDDFMQYERGAYRGVEDASVRSFVWKTLQAAVVRKKDEYLPFKPVPAQVSGVLDALKGIAHQPSDRIVPPTWLEGGGPPADEIVSCRNGLLHVPTAELLPATPRFFTRNALDIDYDPDAAEPQEWKAFVAQTFPEPASAELLRQWFGYLLLPDTSQEKMLLMVGPPRSGKGTIQKVLTELVGRPNICSPSIKSLGGDFGLQPMIGKQVAFLSDIRLGSGSDRAAITETLLRITGRDDVTVDRKNKEAWTGRLSVRFVVSTNELPSLSDNSPALANRFAPLLLEQSHLGREDHGLADRLIAELPGILNWALEGWRSLRATGSFVRPAASEEAIAEILSLGSPVAAFLRDQCRIAPSLHVEKVALFRAWSRWAEMNGHHPGAENHFARNLKAAAGIASSKLRTVSGRLNVFVGIGLTGCETEGGSVQGDMLPDEPY